MKQIKLNFLVLSNASVNYNIMLERSLWNFLELVTLVCYLVRSGIYCS